VNQESFIVLSMLAISFIVGLIYIREMMHDLLQMNICFYMKQDIFPLNTTYLPNSSLKIN